jgi:hypothetical protein
VFGVDEEDDEGADEGEGIMEDVALGSTVSGRVEGGSLVSKNFVLSSIFLFVSRRGIS